MNTKQRQQINNNNNNDDNEDKKNDKDNNNDSEKATAKKTTETSLTNAIQHDNIKKEQQNKKGRNPEKQTLHRRRPER